MSRQDEFLKKARSSREFARRAREMCRFLTQRADAERICAYANELEALASTMERLATGCDDSCEDGDARDARPC